MKRVLIWLCVLMMILSTTTVAMADELGDKREEIQEIDQSIDKVKENLDRVKKEQNDVLEQLKHIDNDLRTKEDELIHIQKELEDTQVLLGNTKIELKEAMEEAKEYEILMGDRLCAIYMMEGTSYLELLIESRSINDFLDRFEMIKIMITCDNEVLDKMIVYKELIQSKKDKLEGQEKTIEETKLAISKQKKEIENKKKEREQILAELKAKEEKYERDIEALEETSRDIGNRIRQILQAQKEKEEQEKKRERENQEAQQKEPVKDQDRGSGEDKSEAKQETKPEADPEPKPETKPEDKYSEGTLSWPVPGYNYISSGYGNRMHPIHKTWKMHNGIDISGGGIDGKNIVAGGDGVVILSQVYGGYGNCVIVDHGGGITTVYAHGSKRLVSVGKKVTRGQAIMTVGSTGISTGSHLHFEVRKNGTPVNPMPYLGR